VAVAVSVLALVSQAVRRHGGRITVENRDGAFFTVYLPVPVTTAERLEPAPHMIQVLIVDDDFMVARIHRSLVERVAGFSVVGEAHTGVDALAAVETLRPDLVLLDIYLPDMSGLDVMRKLRERQRPQVDLIAVTAAKDVDTLRAAMHSGVVHYLIKPFSFETLRERLETYSALKTRLERLTEAEQGDIDRLYSLLRARNAGRLPKGISGPTLESVPRDRARRRARSLRRGGCETGRDQPRHRAPLPRAPGFQRPRRARSALRHHGSAGTPLPVGRRTSGREPRLSAAFNRRPTRSA